MAERIIVTDVAMRDGLQMHPAPVPVTAKLELGEALIAAGLRSLEAGSFVSPKAVPQMAESPELFARLPDRPDVAFWALVPNEKGLDRAIEAGARHIAVVLSVTDSMNRANVNRSVEESAAAFERVLQRCRQLKLNSRAYLAAAFVCPYEGATPVDTVLRWTDRMLTAGAEDIGIADTIGAGTPDHCQTLVSALASRWGADRFSLHLHDTRAMALTLAWVAAQEGIRKFDGSVGGLGGCPFAPGAAGNVATEDLVFMFNSSSYETGIDVATLMNAVAVAEKITGRSLGGRISRWWQSRARD